MAAKLRMSLRAEEEEEERASKRVYDEEKGTADFRKKRVTDSTLNKRINVPYPAVEGEDKSSGKHAGDYCGQGGWERDPNLPPGWKASKHLHPHRAADDGKEEPHEQGKIRRVGHNGV